MAKQNESRKQSTNAVEPLANKPEYLWLTPAMMVKLYGKSKTFWYLLRVAGTGPAFVPLGARTVLYRRDVVEAWLASKSVTSLADPIYVEMVETRMALREEKAKQKEAVESAQQSAFPIHAQAQQPVLSHEVQPLRSVALPSGNRTKRIPDSSESAARLAARIVWHSQSVYAEPTGTSPD